MNVLVQNRFDRRYDDLVALGRSRLPGFAPEWTDHNAHDPGITLMELLAWVAEAQLYSLARVRKDERAAYAALLDVVPGGTRPAEGLLWPDEKDPRSPWKTCSESMVIGTDAVVRQTDGESPTYRPQYKVLWVPARITRLESRHRDGNVEDLTNVNERGGTAYSPFGLDAGPRDVLSITIAVRGDSGLFPPQRKQAKGAHLVLGVRADGTTVPGGRLDEAERALRCEPPPLVTLVTGSDRFPLAVVHDTTGGLLRTGAIVLSLEEVAGSPKEFAIEIQSSRGFVSPPRWLRVTPSVLPITQQRLIQKESHTATGQPDFSFHLAEPGLCFAAGGDSPVTVDVDETVDRRVWTRSPRLFEEGPDAAAYELDESSSRITFGNGVNGRSPADGASVLVSYPVSDGEVGNAARNRKWHVTGFGDVFGLNADPIAGGVGRLDGIGQRREARRRTREDHALVSASDIVEAAKAIPLLGVARAWIAPPSKARPGTVTLVAMRARHGGVETPGVVESRRWLRAIERALGSRMPMGSRLAVVRPAYAEFSIRATVLIEPGRDPKGVKTAIEKVLREKLALVPSGKVKKVRAAGVSVTANEIGAWIRGVEGVTRVAALALFGVDGKVAPQIKVATHALPRIDIGASDINVQRSPPESTA